MPKVLVKFKSNPLKWEFLPHDTVPDGNDVINLVRPKNASWKFVRVTVLNANWKVLYNTGDKIGLEDLNTDSDEHFYTVTVSDGTNEWTSPDHSIFGTFTFDPPIIKNDGTGFTDEDSDSDDDTSVSDPEIPRLDPERQTTFNGPSDR